MMRGSEVVKRRKLKDSAFHCDEDLLKELSSIRGAVFAEEGMVPNRSQTDAELARN